MVAKSYETNVFKNGCKSKAKRAVDSVSYNQLTKSFFSHPSREVSLVENAALQHLELETVSMSNIEKTLNQEHGCIDTDDKAWMYEFDPSEHDKY
jgi:hypothetical protein